jgi:hypothetical protein
MVMGADYAVGCAPVPAVGKRMTDRRLDAHAVAAWLGVPVSWVRESTRSGAMPVSSSAAIGAMCGPTWPRGSRDANSRGNRSGFVG